MTRDRLRARLARELGDEDIAGRVVDGLGDEELTVIVARCDDDLAASPFLDHRPPRVPDGEVDSLWVLAFGFRLRPSAGREGVGILDPAPPREQLEPGPVNEALARVAAEFVATRTVPIVAQWEVAEVLADLGVDGVVAVDPDVADDGTTIYLSTHGVAEKGLRLAAAAGIDPGRAGVVGFAHHTVRCVRTLRLAGLVGAAVPESVTLPSTYDPASGQTWTRGPVDWITTDLLARTLTPDPER